MPKYFQNLFCLHLASSCRRQSNTPVSSETSTISDNTSDDGNTNRRNRTIFSKKQAEYLESVFQTTHYPDLKCRNEISKKTKLTEIRIQVYLM